MDAATAPTAAPTVEPTAESTAPLSPAPRHRPPARLRPSGAVLLLLAGLAAGCGSVSVPTPEGFRVIEDSAREFRAEALDGSRIWVRRFEDPDEIGLEAWADRIVRNLGNDQRYLLESRSEVTSDSGLPGVELQFARRGNAGTSMYLVTIFHDDRPLHDAVIQAEFTARDTVFWKRLEQIQATFRALEG